MTTESSQENAEKEKWQKKLLPLMRQMIVGLAIFFFIASLGQLIYLEGKIGENKEIMISPLFQSGESKKDLSANEKLKIEKQEALMLLEAKTIERRYHQANVLLMSGIWVRYLGFVTGMIIALVGAVFILGKLSEQQSDLNAKVKNFELTFRTASPGLLLSLLGTILMLTTIIMQHTFSVRDVPVYFERMATGDQQAGNDETDSLNLPPLQTDTLTTK